METLQFRDLLYPELLYGKVCRWLDRDIEENVRLALLANDLKSALWEYQDQQDEALARIRKIAKTNRVRETIAINKFIVSLSATMDAIRRAYQEQKKPNQEGKLGTP